MEVTQYIRDKRSPVPKSKVTSKVMSANKAKNTKPELLLRKSLNEIGLSGYRIHHKKVKGRPDISYTRLKIAIFVNGCFWHRCPFCNLSIPKTNSEFWGKKFERNRKRDIEKTESLKAEGWKVFVFWECKIKEDAKSCAKEVYEFIKKIKTNDGHDKK